MLDVFISYRRKGANSYLFSSALNLSLMRRGISSFIDKEEITIGEFNQRVVEVIKSCKLFVLVITTDSIKRMTNSDSSTDNSYLEYLEAIDNGIPILPITIEGDEYIQTLRQLNSEHPLTNLLKLHRLKFDPEDDLSIESVVTSITKVLVEMGQSFNSILDVSGLNKLDPSLLTNIGRELISNNKKVVKDLTVVLNLGLRTVSAVYNGETSSSSNYLHGFGTATWAERGVLYSLNGEWAPTSKGDYTFKGLLFNPEEPNSAHYFETLLSKSHTTKLYSVNLIQTDEGSFIRISNRIKFLEEYTVYLGERLYKVNSNFVGLNYVICKNLVLGLKINGIKLIEYSNYIKSKDFSCPVTYVKASDGNLKKRGYLNYIGEPITIDDSETFKLPFLDVSSFIDVNDYRQKDFESINDYVSGVLYRSYTFNGDTYLVLEVRSGFLVSLIVFKSSNGKFTFNEVSFIEVDKFSNLIPLLLFLNINNNEDNHYTSKFKLTSHSILSKFKEHRQSINTSLNPVLTSLNEEELNGLEYLYLLVGNSDFNNVKIKDNMLSIDFAFYRCKSRDNTNPLYLKSLSFECPLDCLENEDAESLKDFLVFKTENKRIDFGYDSIISQ